MSASRSRSYWPAFVAIVIVLAFIVALPAAWTAWAPSFLRPELKLGLDLAGGTQLDFRISEDEIIERIATITSDIAALQNAGEGDKLRAKQAELVSVQKQHEQLVEAIRSVLERRVNALGVSEATITPSYFGNEKHLLVECPGDINIERCIKTVGKTIRLEFKEEFVGDPKAYEQKVREKIASVRHDIESKTSTLQVIGQDMSNELGVSYVDAQPVYVSELPKGLAPLAKRTATDPVYFAESTVTTSGQDQNGQEKLQQIHGVYMAEVVANPVPMDRVVKDAGEAMDTLAPTLQKSSRLNKTSERLSVSPAELQSTLQSMDIGTTKALSFPDSTAAILYLAGRTEGTERMEASHILVQYAGAERAPASVTRTREEAQALATALRQKIAAGESFTTLARTASDAGSKAKDGSLGVIRRGEMAPAFEKAAFALPKGGISDVVETPFGFHIIRADTAAAVEEQTVTYQLLRFAGTETDAQGLITKISNGEVKRPDRLMVVRSLFFSLTPTGWQDTPLNGERFRAASVSFDNLGTPVVQIQFDTEGGEIFRQLTKRNIGKRIAIFVGGSLVSAPTVQNEISGGNAVITGSRDVAEAQALAQDLNTGAIPAPIFLVGQMTIEPTLGTSALHDSVKAAIIGFIILCVLLILIYRLLGVIASVALLAYITLLIASMKLPILLVTNEHVVLTLAGIAGIILSVGMAVDANVLVFERVREELRRGKSLRSAIDIGFSKAWPSIRDGNASTLITCSILFLIGTSIIRGFAVTLAIGLFISLFTGVVMSRWLCRWLVSTALGKRTELFSNSKPEA